MMKRYVFRKSWNGFYDWINSISKVRNTISSYRSVGQSLRDDPDRIFGYHEALRVYNNYLKLRAMLDDAQVRDLETRSKHRIPDFKGMTIKALEDIYEKWMQLEFPDDAVPLAGHTADEIGVAIKEARLNDGRNMSEVAELLGISFNTYKCYESGRRMIPADRLLMLEDLYCVKFE